MKKFSLILWYFPLCFFIFLTIFVFVKFILIFFFNAAFEPEFMFYLTPYYLLSGVNNLHLLLLSLIVLFFGTYLHVKISKKSLYLSFIPSAIILVGLGYKIAFADVHVEFILNYFIFGLMLFTILTDHNHALNFPEIAECVEKEKRTRDIGKHIPFITQAKPEEEIKPQMIQVPVAQAPPYGISANEIFNLYKETLFDLRAVLKEDIRRSQEIMDDLEYRRKKMDRTEEESKVKLKNLSKCPYSSQHEELVNDKILKYKCEPKMDIKKYEDLVNFDKIMGSATIVKRGIIKKVNRQFVELIGFDSEFLLEKSMFDFIAPESLFNIENYYLNRLKGSKENTYRTAFLTSDERKIDVEIIIKPTIYEHNIADIMIIRNIKGSDKISK